MSWDVILPFLRPLEPFLSDPGVSDILVNGGCQVFVEKRGELREEPGVALNERSLLVAVRNIARVLGDEVSPERPLLDARLPDGSRVTAVLPPCSVTGTVLAIRKFQGQLLSADELVRLGAIPKEALERLQVAVQNRQNLLISGGTGTGKTTLLNALAAFIPPEERILIIEDTSEIQLQAKNLVRLEARREQPGLPAISIRDLIKASLRLRPDRILVGEVRDGAAFDLLQALNTGHSGTLSTLHSDSATKAITRFSTCVLMSGVELPYRALQSRIAEAVNLVIHIERRLGRRVVNEILEVKGYDSDRDRHELQPLYRRDAL